MDKIVSNYSESKKSEKIFVNFYINIPFRWVARLLSSQLKNSFVTPNMVSFLGIFLVLIGSIILFTSNQDNSWRAVPFFFLIGLFAALDGSLAREKELFSPFGSWIGMISERLEYLFVGLSFSWYIYEVTEDFIAMYLALIGYVFRECIGTLSTLTIGKMPPNWKEIYSKDFVYQKSNIIELLVKTFFYTGTTYTLLICIGILFFSSYDYVLFMAIYGFISYFICLLMVGRKVYGVRI